MRGNLRAWTALVEKQYFNSRLYMRGNGRLLSVLPHFHQFQFTPLHERQRQKRHKSSQSNRNFNSRLYMRGNQCAGIWHQATRGFQFTPLHERQLWQGFLSVIPGLFQFTPLHERQRCFVYSIQPHKPISIHAST